MSINLVVGLGNPGPRYLLTRHNVGFTIVEAFVSSFGEAFIDKPRLKGSLSLLEYQKRKIYFFKPLTYMNLSGEAVEAVLSYYRLSLEQLLVVHDELDFPLGTVQLKDGGSSSHNGIKNMVHHLGTPNFWRLRIGIGRPSTVGVTDYVLSKFHPSEATMLNSVIQELVQKLPIFLTQPLTNLQGKIIKTPLSL